MDENKVRKAGISVRKAGISWTHKWDCVAAIKAAVEPLENRLDGQEDVHIELDDRTYYLEKCVHALEDRLEVLEDCESALPEEERLKGPPTDYKDLFENPDHPYCCFWFSQRIKDGTIQELRDLRPLEAPYETKCGLNTRYCPSCGTKL